ncbi:MAG: mechanosensitive ion channel family protein [Rubrivivax sp.]
MNPPAASFIDPGSPVGAALLGALFFALASVVVLLIRGGARRVGRHLSDVTALQFVSALAQALAYLVAFVLYAHLVPELRALGTALLAGVSVVSVVVGLAAQSTLGNLIAGFSLVLYRQVRVGDMICLAVPTGTVTARLELISLGFTVLRDDQQHEVIVPNSVMMSSTIVRVGRAAG